MFSVLGEARLHILKQQANIRWLQFVDFFMLTNITRLHCVSFYLTLVKHRDRPFRIIQQVCMGVKDNVYFNLSITLQP
jgi:hypothetical protein